MPKFPFKRYHYNKGDYYLNDDVDTYINIEEIYNDNKVSIVASQPQLVEVEYTNDRNKLFPKIKNESIDGAVEIFLAARDLKDLEDIPDGVLKFDYDVTNIGKYKRLNWSFQKEWRYMISILPIGMQESNPPSLEIQQDILKKLEDETTEVPYERLFLDLDENVFDDMEILFGPKMTESEKVLVKSLIEKYCPKCIYRESSLRIR